MLYLQSSSSNLTFISWKESLLLPKFHWLELSAHGHYKLLERLWNQPLQNRKRELGRMLNGPKYSIWSLRNYINYFRLRPKDKQSRCPLPLSSTHSYTLETHTGIASWPQGLSFPFVLFMVQLWWYNQVVDIVCDLPSIHFCTFFIWLEPQFWSSISSNPSSHMSLAKLNSPQF